MLEVDHRLKVVAVVVVDNFRDIALHPNNNPLIIQPGQALMVRVSFNSPFTPLLTMSKRKVSYFYDSKCCPSPSRLLSRWMFS